MTELGARHRGGALHIVANWKTFKSYFSRKAALAIISRGVIVTIAAIAIPSYGKQGNPIKRISMTLSTASVETLAPVIKLTPEQTVAKLEQKGMKVTDASQTIKEIATANNSEEPKVIMALFE